MIFVFIVLVIFLLNYLVLYWVLIVNDRPVAKEDSSKRQDFFVSVVIPFRNEEKNMQNLLKSLFEQSFSKNMFELILVNDHSTDGSVNIVLDLKKTSEISITLIELVGEVSGKKAALEAGFNASKGDIIIQTDADVVFDRNWIREHVNAHRFNQSLLVCGAVGLTGKNNFFHRVQMLEMDALMISTKLTIDALKPVMCNAANLSFKRELLSDVFDSYRNYKSSSGDDVFLLQLIKTKYGAHRISFMDLKESIVETEPISKIKELICQRSRWAKKSKEYKDVFALYFTSTIVLANISMLALGLYGVFLDSFQWILLVFIPFLLKWFTDLSLIYFYKRLNQKAFDIYWLFDSLFIEIVYPFYILIVGLNVLFSKQMWKGRISR